MVLARRLGASPGGTLIMLRMNQGPTINPTPRQPNTKAFHLSARLGKASTMTGRRARNTGLKSARMPRLIPNARYDAALILALPDNARAAIARLSVTKKAAAVSVRM